MHVTYESLSPEAKVWIYPSNRKFYPQEIDEIHQKITAFINGWKIEDETFKASYQFLYNRFIILLTEEGSSIVNKDVDAQVSFILQLQKDYSIELLDKMNVCFKQGEFVQYKELKEFKKLLKNKSVSSKNIVFDNLVQTKFELETYWEVPITESWYNRFL